MSTVTSESSTRKRAGGKAEAGKTGRTDLNLFLEDEVYPKLFERLDSAFPEFNFQRTGSWWTAGSFPTSIPIKVERQSTDRLVSYPDSWWGVMVHGHHLVRWIDYLNGGQKPTGDDFLPVVRKLCKLAGVAFPEAELSPEDAEKARRWEERRAMLRVAEVECQKIFWSKAGAEARAYLHGRGFTDDDLKNLGVGLYLYERLTGPMKDAGHDIQAAKDAGVLWRRMDGYIVFPWHDAQGSILTLYGKWTGKTPPKMNDHEGSRYKREALRKAWEAMADAEREETPWVEPSIPKTMALLGSNTKASPLYFDRARKAGHRTLVAVEGVTDAAILQLKGETRTIAYVAAEFSTQQVETMKRQQVDAVILCPDPDGGGDKGCVSSIKALARAGIASYVAPRLPDGQDPDEFVVERGIEGWREHVANPTPGAVYLAMRMLDGITPESPEIERRKKADEVAAYVERLKDAWDRTAVLKLAAKLTGFSVADIKKKVKSKGDSSGRKERGRPGGVAGGASQAGGTSAEFPVEYGDADGYLVHIGEDREGAIEIIPIANFTARITREFTRHSGGRVARQYQIEARNVLGASATATIDAEAFSRAGVGGAFGADFGVTANAERHVRAAIQLLSARAGIPKTVVYTHTGWVEYKGRSFYLHAGGAIGADGPLGMAVIEDDGGREYSEIPGEEVIVEVDPALSKYRLPDPPLGRQRRHEAIRASLDLLKLGRTRRPNAKGIAAVLASLPYRAALRQSPGTVHFTGGTGARKTTAACLAVQHFAPGHSHDQPTPATWEGTSNSLQSLQHDAKDSILLIDELIADGPTAERDLAKASGTFSAQGNATGKRRMRQDLTLAPGMDPRGTLLSTGETSPSRRSALGRSLVVNFTPETQKAKGSIPPPEGDDLLSMFQGWAAEGLFAEAMSAYIQDIAGRRAEAMEEHSRVTTEQFDEAVKVAKDAHPRCAMIVAELGAAYAMFVGFAERDGAIDSATANALVDEQWEGLVSLLGDQARIQEETDTAQRFTGLLASALVSGKVYLADRDGKWPKGCEAACGWTSSEYRDTRGELQTSWQPATPGAAKIGWTDGGHLFLLQDAAMAAVQRLAGEERTPLGEAKAVWARLAETGILAPDTRGGKTRYATRKTFEGAVQMVAKVETSAIWGKEEPEEG